MNRMVDPVQRHIWYATCASCGGSYLDAGELKGLSSHKIAEFFRDLTAPERTLPQLLHGAIASKVHLAASDAKGGSNAKNDRHSYWHCGSAARADHR
jgi:hypothetical protein